MKYWVRNVIRPYCQDFGYKSICEIGASFGGATDIILEQDDVRLVVVDPCLDADLCAKYSNDKRLAIHKGLSLEVIPRLSEKFDCILIDGDHNWYTVFNELKAIEEKQLLKDGGTIFFHDVGWPYGRRDMYYQPDTIPKAFLRAHSRNGIIYGRSELSADGANEDMINAEAEGGEKNGVLTAIEDFLSERQNDYVLFHFKDECGLGVMVRKNGNKSKGRLAMWRLKCWIHNTMTIPKRILMYRFPKVYRSMRSTAGKA